MAHLWVSRPDNESARLDVITWLRCRVGEVETAGSDGPLWLARAGCLPYFHVAAVRIGIWRPVSRRAAGGDHQPTCDHYRRHLAREDKAGRADRGQRLGAYGVSGQSGRLSAQVRCGADQPQAWTGLLSRRCCIKRGEAPDDLVRVIVLFWRAPAPTSSLGRTPQSTGGAPSSNRVVAEDHLSRTASR